MQTYRHYLLDARFGVLIEGPAALLEEIAAALRNPKWGVWLGRKCCLPASPVLAAPPGRSRGSVAAIAPARRFRRHGSPGTIRPRPRSRPHRTRRGHDRRHARWLRPAHRRTPRPALDSPCAQILRAHLNKCCSGDAPSPRVAAAPTPRDEGVAATFLRRGAAATLAPLNGCAITDRRYNDESFFKRAFNHKSSIDLVHP